LVKAKVRPNSPEFKLEWKGEALHVWLTEPAEGNKANVQLLKELARIFGSCKIVRGASSRSKVLDLPVGSLRELESSIKRFLSD
jgi:uncharacterized protein YggU (UPF0235/DUF167 family)